jgi:hypothetical protein
MQKYIFFFQIYTQKYPQKGRDKNKKCRKSAIHGIFAFTSNNISCRKN